MQGELSSIVGARVKALRERDGVTLDAVARAGQSAGLPWRRVTVAAIEQGRRRLTIEELALLPWLLERAGVQHGTRALLGDDDRIDLAPRVTVSGWVLAGMLGRPGETGFVLPQADDPLWAAMRRGGREAAEMRAAEALGARPRDIAMTAVRLWGRSLSEERDARLAQRTDLAGRDIHRAAGHVTRQLIRELREYAERGGEDASRGDETP